METTRSKSVNVLTEEVYSGLAREAATKLLANTTHLIVDKIALRIILGEAWKQGFRAGYTEAKND